MKNNRNFFRIVCFLLLFFLIYYNNDMVMASTVYCTDNLKADNSNNEFLGKTASGPINFVPWENNEQFKAAFDKSGARVMLSAYRTILKDPLPGEEENVHLAAKMLAGTIIKPGEIFSQNHTIGPYNESRGFRKGPTYMGTNLTTTVGGGVCKIASTLYNVTVLSNLKVIERHPHSMPVPYVPYGQDATVSYGVKDFKFQNTDESNIMIWAEGIDNILYMAFYGGEEPPVVEWNHLVLQTIKAPINYKNNPDLKDGEEKVILEGMDGAVIKSWVNIKAKDGTVETKQMGKSWYSPMPYIIERKS